MVTRLQLGTSRLEHLDRRALDAFVDETWIHLGDDSPPTPRPLWIRLQDAVRRGPKPLLRSVRAAVSTSRNRGGRLTASQADALYARTDFRPFYFRKGDRLPFEDASFHYIFSEHFLHHLFLDEATALLRECRRMLAPWGVLRTVVPDADLRTYEPPEPAGFPDPRMPFTAPLKHKTRYSVYSLSETLRLVGLEPVPIRYCDREGNYVRKGADDLAEIYARCPERRFVFDFGHIMRIDSLVVDGLNVPGGAGV